MVDCHVWSGKRFDSPQNMEWKSGLKNDQERAYELGVKWSDITKKK